MRKVLLAFTIGIFFAAAGLAAKGKDRYLVIAPHTAEQCLSVLDDVNEHDRAVKLISVLRPGNIRQFHAAK